MRKLKSLIIPFLLPWRRLLATRLAQDTYWSFGLKIASAGLLFLIAVVLARLLGPKGYGTYAYAYSISMLLAMPTNTGLQNLVLRETAHCLAQNRMEKLKGLWKWGDRVAIVVSLIVVSIIGSVIVIWQWRLEASRGSTLLCALALVPLISFSSLRSAALRGLKHIIMGQLAESLFRPGLFLVALVCTAIVAGITLSPALSMALHAGAALVAFLIASILLWLYTPAELAEVQPSIDTKAWLTSGSVLALIGSLDVLNNQASTVILAFFEPMDQVGVYRVAAQVATFASFGLQTVNVVVAPRFARLHAEGDKKRLQHLVTASARVVLIINLFLTTVFVFFGPSFFPVVFGHKFSRSYGPLLILLIGQVVNSATGSVGFLLNMTRNEQETVWGLAIAAGMNILLNLTLVPVWNIRGAALAKTISMIVWNLILWWRVRKVLGINSSVFSRRARNFV